MGFFEWFTKTSWHIGSQSFEALFQENWVFQNGLHGVNLQRYNKSTRRKNCTKSSVTDKTPAKKRKEKSGSEGSLNDKIPIGTVYWVAHFTPEATKVILEHTTLKRRKNWSLWVVYCWCISSETSWNIDSQSFEALYKENSFWTPKWFSCNISQTSKGTEKAQKTKL